MDRRHFSFLKQAPPEHREYYRRQSDSGQAAAFGQLVPALRADQIAIALSYMLARGVNQDVPAASSSSHHLHGR
jgi:hypothetical protein